MKTVLKGNYPSGLHHMLFFNVGNSLLGLDFIFLFGVCRSGLLFFFPHSSFSISSRAYVLASLNAFCHESLNEMSISVGHLSQNFFQLLQPTSTRRQLSQPLPLLFAAVKRLAKVQRNSRTRQDFLHKGSSIIRNLVQSFKYFSNTVTAALPCAVGFV